MNTSGEDSKKPQRKLRYILYARKSTEDSKSQVRSIDDQVKECKEKAERDGLYIAKVIREEKSAKKAYNRPQFTEMLKDIEDGKYDGILSWHPDRLSRNSLEAGIMVDMLDNGVIKDLQFVACQFSNDSSGKMLLNILFAISKQYSEHISEGVLRAYNESLPEGKSSGTPKWGYNRDGETGLYVPDENFDLFRKAWDMKLANRNNTDILKFLIKNNVKRMTKLNRKNKTSRPIIPNINSIGGMFRDPFYYGILVQAGKEVDLREATNNFVPMITEEEYAKVQEIIASGRQGRRGITKKNRAVFYPLRGMVTCGECGSPMYTAASASSSKKKQKYLYFRCDNKNCHRTPKSVRAKVVFDAIYEAVDRMSFTDEQFKLYNDKMETYTEEKKNELIINKRSIDAQIRAKTTKIREVVLALQKLEEGSKAYSIEQELLASLETDVCELDEELRATKEKIENANQARMNKDEFLNLMKILPDKIRNGSIAEKDVLARMMFLNCTIDAQNRATFLWKEPFATLLEGQTFTIGAPD